MVSGCSFLHIFAEKHFIAFLFPSDSPVWIEFFPLKNLIILAAAVAGIMFFLRATATVKNNAKMTRKAYYIYTGFMIILLAFPLIFYPSRTEITSEAITRHSISGQNAEIYILNEAEKVTLKLEASASGSGRTMPKTHLNFKYEIEFKDGNTYTLEAKDDDLWWKTISEIDNVITKNKVEKEVFGKSLDEIIYQFDSAYSVIKHRDELLKIMNS